MTAFLRALSRRIRLAIHHHDPIECWCEVTKADAIRFFCVYCSAERGQPHEPWCSRAVSR